MNVTYFNPVGVEFVELIFDCYDCLNIIETDGFEVPTPIADADKNESSSAYAEYDTMCPNCESEFNIELTVDHGGGYITISELPSNASVVIKEISIEDEFIEDQIDAYLWDTDKMKTFRSEITKLKQLLILDIQSPDVHKTLLKQIYTGTITCMEDYLSTTLVQEVLNNKSAFRRFVKKDKELSKRTCKFEEIYETIDGLEKIVKERLLSIQYHNIALVSSLYKIVFNYELPEYSEIGRIVSDRHHMVHRNGKTKEGEEILIDARVVDSAVKTVEEFIQKIDNTIAIL